MLTSRNFLKFLEEKTNSKENKRTKSHNLGSLSLNKKVKKKKNYHCPIMNVSNVLIEI